MSPSGSTQSSLKFPTLGELPLLFLGGVQQYAGLGATPTAAPQPQQAEPVMQQRARNHSRRTSAQAGIILHTECERCGEHVEMSLPQWITAALEGQPHPQLDHRPTRPTRRSELRDGVVNGAVQCAVAIKQSPLIPFLFQMVVSFFQCLHYLNKRFDLLAKAWDVFVAFLEGLLELEQKLGICRQVGDGVSVAWETALRTTIELGKTDDHSEPFAPTDTYPYPASPLQHTTDGGLNLFAEEDAFQLSPVEDLPSFPAVTHRHLRRTAHSSPHLPLMISRSNSSSHLQPQGGGEGDYAIFTGRAPVGVGAQQQRRRSRSGGDQEELQIPDVDGLRGWAARGVAGVVTRVGARISGVAAE